MQRWSEYRDRAEIRALWKLRFGDHDRFLDWFFGERFSPATSAVTEEDGRILTSIQSFPFPVKIRDAVLPGAVIAGVSTLPEAEGRGHMGRTMRFYMNGIAARGAVVIPYRPEILAMYAGFGHYPVTDTVYFRVDAPVGGVSPAVVPLDFRRDESLIWDCYRRAAGRYSGIIARSLADMRLKLYDYAADDGRALGIFEDFGRLSAYAVYFEREERYVEEFLANDPGAETALFSALSAVPDGRALRGKLPPDTALHAAGLLKERRPMNVMGVADVSALLSAVCHLPDYTVEVQDRTVSANHGVFTFSGKPTEKAPQIRLDAGRLTQFVCGYRSLSELAARGEAEILDAGAARELDAALPPMTCYSLDEY